ncbi:MAG: xylanase [Reichenbachiella sp.]
MSNNNKIFWISVLIITTSLQGCNKSEENPPTLPPIQPDVLTIRLQPSRSFQTINNFGASDAWSTQFVGDNWPEASKVKMAELLFSMDIGATGDPVGIGLSAWRFNIGAGSTAQGELSEINDEWRRAPSFIDENEMYDWTRQKGQLWFLEKAKSFGVERFVGFVNSPPVVYTTNGKAWSDFGFGANIEAANYGKYADYLVEIVKNIRINTGITFDYISPFNEPQWEWKCCGQEGSPWNNDEIADMTKVLAERFDTEGIASKIEITEAGQIDFLYFNSRDPNRSDQIKNFYSPSSTNYLGDLSSVAHKIVGHSYYTTWDLNLLVSSREKLISEIGLVDPTLDYWMTEYTLLEDNEEVSGNGRDLGIDPALYMARVIHADLTIANAAAWQWWLAISPYDYKDGLIYIDHNKNGGNYYESKMLWALGQYSRFVRPGMERIHTTRSDNVNSKENVSGLLESAFQSESQVVVVLVNQEIEEKHVTFSGLDESYDSLTVYMTTGEEGVNLKISQEIAIQDTVIVPKRALVTCVME